MLELASAAVRAQPLTGKTPMFFGFRVGVNLGLRYRGHRLRGEALDKFAHEYGRDRTIELHVVKVLFELIMNLVEQLKAFGPIFLQEKRAAAISEFV